MSLKINFYVQSITKQGTYFRYHNLAKGLQNLGHDIIIYAPDYSKGAKTRTELNDNIRYEILDCYFPFQSFFGQTQHPLVALKRMMHTYRSCHVSHVFQPFMSAYMPWRVNKKKSSLSLYDWDDLWYGGLIKDIDNKKFKWFKNTTNYFEKHGPVKADVATVCSGFLHDRAQALGAKNVEIVHNGYWQFEPLQKQTSRQQLGLSENALYIGFMGRTISELNWCIDLLKNSSKHFPNLRLALCGMPKEAVTEIAGEYENLIDYLGYLTPEDTRVFSSALDIGLLPLENDDFNNSRFPIKFAEYLAAGAPVLCSSVGEVSKLSKNIPFVKEAGKTHEEWLSNGNRMLNLLANNNLAPVDIESVSEILSWNSICKNLESVYIRNLEK